MSPSSPLFVAAFLFLSEKRRNSLQVKQSWLWQWTKGTPSGPMALALLTQLMSHP